MRKTNTAPGSLSRAAGRAVALCLLAALLTGPARAQDGVDPDKKVLSGHRGPVRSLAFKSDSTLLASCDGSTVFKLWNAETGALLQDLRGNVGVNSVAFSEAGLVTGGSGADPETDRERGEVLGWSDDGTSAAQGVQTRVECIAILGTQVVAGGAHMHPDSEREYGLIQLWQANELRPVRQLPGEYGETFRSVALSANGTWLAAGSGGEEDENLGRLTLWNRSNFNKQILARLQGVVYAVAFDPEGKSIVYGGVKIAGGRKVGFVTIREIATGKEESRQVPEAVRAVAFGPNGELAVGSGSAVAILLAERDPVTLPTSGIVHSLAVSPDGKALAAGGSDGRVTLWREKAQAPEPPKPNTPSLVLKVIDAVGKAAIRDPVVTVFGEGVRYTGGDREGNHTFAVPAAGNYKVSVSKEGYTEQVFTIQVGAQGHRRTVALERAAATPKPLLLILTIADDADGKPMDGATITVSGDAKSRGRTAEGTQSFTVPGPGTYKVTVSKDGFVSAEEQIKLTAPQTKKTIWLKRKAAAPKPLVLTLAIVDDSTGEPVLDSRVAVSLRGAAVRGSGARGIYTCTVPEVGAYEVTVTKKGYADRSLSLSIGSPEEGRHTISIKRMVALVLSIVDAATGQAIPECVVSMAGVEAVRERSAAGDSSHRYRLVPGSYKVTFAREGYRSTTESIELGSETTNRTVRLERTALLLLIRVRDARNQPMAGLGVTTPTAAEVTHPAEGSYAVRLPPGLYELEVTSGSETFEKRRVTIGGEDTAVDLAPSPPDPQNSLSDLHKRLDTNADLRVNAADFPAQVWELLKAYDRDASGELEAKELAPMLKAPIETQKGAAAPAAAADSVSALHARLDTNLDGKVDSKDFAPAAWELLSQHDANRNGSLDGAELTPLVAPRPASSARGNVVAKTPQDVEAALDLLVSRLDTDGNKRIDKSDLGEGVWRVLGQYDAKPTDGVLSREELRPLVSAAPTGNTPTPEPAKGSLTIRRVEGG